MERDDGINPNVERNKEESLLRVLGRVVTTAALWSLSEIRDRILHGTNPRGRAPRKRNTSAWFDI